MSIVCLDLEEFMDINDKNDNSKSLSKKESRNKFTLIIILGVIVFVITNISSYIIGLNLYLTPLSGLSNLSKDVNSYRKIVLVKSILDRAYNGEINNDNLLDNAIKGMVNSLNDPYTTYMNKKEFEEFNLRSGGEYFGIGIQLAYRDNKVVVVSVFDGSAAYKAGIYTGDIITKVSGEEIDSIDKAISLIKGSEGEEVIIEIKRGEEYIKFNVRRERIVLKNIEYSKVDDNIGYIKLSSFDENSSKELRRALEELKVKGLILDLRGNPGGLLNQCLDIASEFLSEGSTIVSTDDKFGENNIFKAKKGIAEDVSLVVIGDSGSASASEVLIGALKDYKRAVFVGEKTFGKGLVQRVFDLKDGSGLKVTVSKYYTPNREYINGVGIKPDVEVAFSQEDYIKFKEQSLGDSEKFKSLDPQYQEALRIIKEKVK